MNVHQKPRAGILLEVDLSVRPESYYYYYYYYYCRREHSSSSTVAFAILVKVNILHPAPQVEFADVHSTQSLLADGTIRLPCNIAVT